MQSRPDQLTIFWLSQYIQSFDHDRLIAHPVKAWWVFNLVQGYVLLEVEQSKVKKIVNLALLYDFFVIILCDFAKEVDQLGSQWRPVELLKYAIYALSKLKAAAWLQKHQFV